MPAENETMEQAFRRWVRDEWDVPESRANALAFNSNAPRLREQLTATLEFVNRLSTLDEIATLKDAVVVAEKDERAKEAALQTAKLASERATNVADGARGVVGRAERDRLMMKRGGPGGEMQLLAMLTGSRVDEWIGDALAAKGFRVSGGGGITEL